MIHLNREEIILEDERVVLRPLVKKDLEHLLVYSENEPGLWEFSLVSAAGRKNLEAYIDLALEGREKGNEYPFLVYDKKLGAYAGTTRYYDIQPGNLTLQLGYTWYGKKFQGTGLNRHCKFLLLSYAFEVLNAERVEFRADNNNLKSIAAMKSIGCRVDGVLRSNMPRPGGGRRDSIVLSILKEEWFDGVKQKLMHSISSPA